MRLHKILLVEDDPFISALSVAFLKQHFDVSLAADAAAALKTLARQSCELVLLDLGLPDEDGLVLARQIRAKYQDIAIIFLTSRDTKADMVAGLEIGGDDYILKPFDPDILLARMLAVLRRSGGGQQPRNTLTVHMENDALEIDLASRRVRIGDNGDLELTRAEFDVLLALSQAAGRILSRGQLSDVIATRPDHDADERVIDALISKIRRKMTALGVSPSPIETMRGIGYRIASK